MGVSTNSHPVWRPLTSFTLAREWGEALAAAGDEEAVEEWRRDGCPMH